MTKNTLNKNKVDVDNDPTGAIKLGLVFDRIIAKKNGSKIETNGQTNSNHKEKDDSFIIANKPIISDFDLSQDDIDYYDKQIHKYREKIRINKEEVNRHNSRVHFGIGTFVIIASFAIGISLAATDKGLLGLLGFIILLGGLFWGLTIFVSDKYYEKPYTIFHEEQFVDRKLSKKIADYEAAMTKYNEAVKRQQELIKIKKREEEELQQQLAKRKKNYWLGLSGFEFEREVANLYRKLGYDVLLTKSTGDGGIDIKLKKEGVHIGVQCKNHARPIGPNDVRAFIGVLVSGNFSSGIFVSSNGLTQIALQESKASPIPIELVTLDDLLAINRDLEKHGMNKEFDKSPLPEQKPVKKTKQNNYEPQELSVKENNGASVKVNPYIGGGVRVGKLVKLLYVDTKEKFFFQMVEESDADPLNGKLSIKSPIGSALLGKNEGEVICVELNEKIIEIKILEVTVRVDNPFI